MEIVKIDLEALKEMIKSTIKEVLEENNHDKTVKVFGTFGDTLTIQGSNDGTNWATLSDSTGVPLEFTAAGIKLIAECPRYIRPSAGASITSVTVIIQATRS